MNSKYVTFGCVLLAAACSRAQDEMPLTDSFIKQQLEHSWKSGFIVIPLGQLSALGGPAAELNQPNRLKGEVSQQDLNNFRVLDQMQVIHLTAQQNLSRGFTNWNDWMALTQGGVQVRFTMTPAERAKEVQCSDDQKSRSHNIYGDREVLCLPEGTATIERIVSNEARTIGVDHYRIVMGTHIWNQHPIYLEWERRLGGYQSKERKFVVAFKFDPFANEWRSVAADIADRAKEFSTRNVNKLLGVE